VSEEEGGGRRNYRTIGTNEEGEGTIELSELKESSEWGKIRRGYC